MAIDTKLAQAIVNDILVGGGIASATDSKRLRNESGYLGYDPSDCKAICNFIIDRSWAFEETEYLFTDSTYLKVNTDITGDGYDVNARINQKKVYQALAWFCSEAEIFWDDVHSTRSAIEMETYKKSVFGNELWASKCFLSQRTTDDKAKTAATRTASTRPAGSGPVIDYKHSGGHIKEIPNLIIDADNTDSAGKVYLHKTYDKLFCIIADKVGKNTPRAYITPIKATADGAVTVSKAEAEKVRLGSGNGYTDSRLWFTDNSTADAFLIKVKEKFTGGKFDNIRVVKGASDSNGYIKVSTEFGDAYIQTNRLNEEITEAADKDAKEKEVPNKYKTSTFRIADIDVYEEAYLRYDN